MVQRIEGLPFTVNCAVFVCVGRTRRARIQSKEGELHHIYVKCLKERQALCRRSAIE